jgi:hypothetical protein
MYHSPLHWPWLCFRPSCQAFSQRGRRTPLRVEEGLLRSIVSLSDVVLLRRRKHPSIREIELRFKRTAPTARVHRDCFPIFSKSQIPVSSKSPAECFLKGRLQFIVFSTGPHAPTVVPSCSVKEIIMDRVIGSLTYRPW